MLQGSSPAGTCGVHCGSNLRCNRRSHALTRNVVSEVQRARITCAGGLAADDADDVFGLPNIRSRAGDAEFDRQRATSAIDFRHEGIDARNESFGRFLGVRPICGPFLAQIATIEEQARRAILCDVSNIYLSAHNLGFDRDRYIAVLPLDAIAELHLGGFTSEPEEGGEVLIDTHGSRIAEPVWAFYARALERFGRKPTLIEWDNDVPTLDVILAEAARADAVTESTFAPRPRHALAS